MSELVRTNLVFVSLALPSLLTVAEGPWQKNWDDEIFCDIYDVIYFATTYVDLDLIA